MNLLYVQNDCDEENLFISSHDATLNPSWVCSVAWISQRPPEPLTRVQIPADPLLYNKNNKDIGLMNSPCLQSQCVHCCLNTSMLLSQQDIKKLVHHGYHRDFFCREHDGWLMLKNSEGRCVFHDGTQCTVYPHRPQGCLVYPLIFDEETKSVILDSECPYHMLFSMTRKQQLEVHELVQQIIYERNNRLQHTSRK